MPRKTATAGKRSAFTRKSAAEVFRATTHLSFTRATTANAIFHSESAAEHINSSSTDSAITTTPSMSFSNERLRPNCSRPSIGSSGKPPDSAQTRTPFFEYRFTCGTHSSAGPVRLFSIETSGATARSRISSARVTGQSPTKRRMTPGSGDSKRSAFPVTGCSKPSSAACSARRWTFHCGCVAFSTP